MAPLVGGVPERPKGTGCKPVGSAYGGSNPPAPTLLCLTEKAEKVTDRVVTECFFAEGLRGHDAVVAAPGVAFVASAGDIAGVAKLAEDEGHSSFTETEPIRHVTHAQSGLALDGEQEPGMVRKKRPFGHELQSFRLVEPRWYL